MVEVSARGRSCRCCPRCGGAVEVGFESGFPSRAGHGGAEGAEQPRRAGARCCCARRDGGRDVRLQRWAGPHGNFHLAASPGGQRGHGASTSRRDCPLPRHPARPSRAIRHRFLLTITQPDARAQPPPPELAKKSLNPRAKARLGGKAQLFLRPGVLTGPWCDQHGPGDRFCSQKLTGFTWKKPSVMAGGQVIAQLDDKTSKERLQALQTLLKPLDSLGLLSITVQY